MSRYVIVSEQSKAVNKLLQKYSENQQELTGQHPATHNFIQKYVDIQNDSVAEFSDLLNAAVLVNTNDKFQTLYFEQTYF